MMKFTHYKKLPNGKTILFNLYECENCNTVALAPNSIGGIQEDIPKYEQLGMQEYNESLPEEVAYNENLDMTVCEDCFTI
jgi:hypothetical protein